ncbi:MAG: hypothetical protein NC936_01185 [Candidatus Omnitrophica bacterium]|nr:hypothetical protein [Candidatus Omnitrophota bacterium]MCM8770468.1 hypothetical protein [Candidatus Omnitrophota bacterium]
MLNKLILIFIVFAIFSSFRLVQAEEYLSVPAAIHISSVVSDGKLTIPQIVDCARKNNFKVLIITDRDIMRWEYGLKPFVNIIKRRVEEPSVFKYGIRKYLDLINYMQNKNPDLILIPAVESTPYYYWQGSIFNNTLELLDWHKHILVIGMDKESDYKYLPVVANKSALMLPFKFKNIFYFVLPLLVFLSGIFLLRRWYIYYRHVQKTILILITAIFWSALIIIGLLSLLNNYPFRDYKFNPYQGNLGALPYQNFIDYVSQRGGLTFWAHPEAENISEICRIKIITAGHAQDLLKTKDYTGFCVFYEGYQQIGKPGGIWDGLLLDYCKGIRRLPVWAIGGLAFDYTGDLDEYMKDLRNILLVERLDKGAVLDALRKGRVYVLKGKTSSHFTLDKFIVKDTLSSSFKTMGELIEICDNLQIQISAHLSDERVEHFTVRLIRNGSVVKTFDVTTPFDIIYQDNYDLGSEMIYYRLEIQSPGLLLVTNPIFVRRKKEK